MNTEQMVEKQLQEEYQKFENEIYKGKIEVPKDIIENFKKAVLVLAPQFHGILANRIKAISGKEPLGLTNFDLFAIIKITNNTPLEKVYGNDFNVAIEKQIKFEKFILSYNQSVEEFQGLLQMKKKTLMDLAGANNGRNNGMRIIPQA